MISVNASYWIWLTMTLGYNNPKIKRIFELYNDVSKFYNGGETEWRFCGFLTENEIQKMSKKHLDDTNAIINRCVELNYSIICIDDEKYPDCLYNIEAPPALIYVSGNLPDIDHRLTIGIVGTRRAENYGFSNSYKIGYALAKYGVAIISGGALGVDCASHRGALATDGVTVCVLGCGINYPYLVQNEDMRQAITRRGAVVSEYPPDTPPKNYHFPARNRIISAFSDGLLVIQAGIKSGSLITAGIAGEQGKTVFALIGNNAPENEGSNKLIKDGIAVPVTDFMDILVEFDNLYVTDDSVDFDNISLEDIKAVPVKGKLKSNKPNNKDKIKDNKNINTVTSVKKNKEKVHNNNIKNKIDLNLSDTAQQIYEYISCEPVHIDRISSDLQIPVFKVLTAMTELEMAGVVKALQGRKYIRN